MARKHLKVDVRRVNATQTANASAIVIGGESAADGDAKKVRVRVMNSGDSESSRFRIAWEGSDNTIGASGVNEMSAQVPPGETRVLRMPAPAPGVTSLVLRDDDHSFDNRRYFVSPQPVDLTLLYVGDVSASSERDSLYFYLQRIPLDNLRRKVTVNSIDGEKLLATPDPKTTPLIVLGQSVSSDVTERLKSYVKSGGRLLCVLGQPSDVDMRPTIENFAGVGIKIDEAQVDEYSMLSQIKFSHPLFQPMADPKYNDFTKVRFWSHRSIEGLPESWNVLAEFDGGGPALVEHSLGEGKVWILTAGWQPEASQLARSTKFLAVDLQFLRDTRREGGYVWLNRSGKST